MGVLDHTLIGKGTPMPSLIRFLVVCALIAGCIFGAMVALANLVEPNQREMTVRIPADKLDVNQ